MKDVPLHLPMIDELLNARLIGTKRPLAGWQVLMVQHVLGSTVPLILALEAAGVERGHMEVVGKAYSSSRSAVNFLMSRGYHVRVATRGYRREVPYEDILRRELSKTLTAIARIMPNDQRLLVLDEGGSAIDLLHSDFAELLPKTSCVEQTARGIWRLADIDLLCPVINVARSWAKSELEAPIIARGMLKALEQGLKDWKEIFALKNRRALVLGYGAIGQHVCREFARRDFEVSVLDCDRQKTGKAARSGYRAIETLLEADLEGTGIIAGCTGGASVGSEAAQHAGDRTLLVNMASSDLEFQPWRLKNAEVVHERLLDDDGFGEHGAHPIPWRSLYRVGTPKGHLFLANGGFPIDFTGALDPIPAWDIQLTRALMLTAALQAAESRRFGLVDLDREVQRWLAERFTELQTLCDL